MEQKVMVEKIRESQTNKLVLSRVPPATMKRFLELCNEENFCTDRGMLLKHLVDFYDGLIPKGWEHLEVELYALNERILALEQSNKNNSDGVKVKKRLGV